MAESTSESRPKRHRDNSDQEGQKKKQKRVFSLETKLEILKRLERGEGPSAIGRLYGVNESTIRSINANKSTIQCTATWSTSQSAKIIKQCRNPLVEQTETLLLQWIADVQAQDTSGSEQRCKIDSGRIRDKAKEIFARLKQNQEGNGEPEVGGFAASKGWFDRFKKRHDLDNTNSVGVDEVVDHSMPQEIMPTIVVNGYTSQQVFYTEKTTLYWKRLPNRTYISKEERKASGFKAANDRLTVLFCGNANGDFKCKPLLVYHSENPRAFKRIRKSHLPVHWKASKKCILTDTLFDDWFNKCFCLEVLRYCTEQNIGFKALLLLENAPYHSPHLETIHPNIKVMPIPPTTVTTKSIYNEVIAMFKKHYIRHTLQAMVEYQYGPKMQSLRESWRSYNIVDAIQNVKAAWDEMNSSTMNSAWRKLWPECINDIDEEAHAADRVLCHNCSTVATIVSLGKRLGGEGFDDMHESDILELAENHGDEQTAEELRNRVISLEEQMDENELPEPVDSLTIENLTALVTIIDNGITFAKTIDSDYERSEIFMSGLLDALAPYKMILEEKKNAARQPTILKYFKRIPK